MVVAIVVLSLVATIAFSAGKRLGLKQVPLCSPCPACERCEQSLNQPSPTASPAIDPITGWKIYRNEELGFEVKYSNNWNPESLLGGDEEKNVFFMHKDSKKLMIPGFSIGRTNKSPQEVISLYVDNIATPDNRNVKPEIFMLGGVNATKMTFDTAIGGKSFLIFAAYKGRSYKISSPEYGDPLMLKEVDQVLSTFKFLN